MLKYYIFYNVKPIYNVSNEFFPAVKSLAEICHDLLSCLLCHILNFFGQFSSEIFIISKQT